MNHFDTLEVSPNASPEVIRAAYKSLMQHFHPDKNPGNLAVAARAAAIAHAYDVLSDPAKRATYASSLQLDARHGVPVAPSQWPGPDFFPAHAPDNAVENSAGRLHARRGVAAVDRAPRIGLWWWLLLLIVVVGAGAFASLAPRKIEPRAELALIRQNFASATATEAQKRQLYARKLGLLEQHPELLRAASAEKSENMAGRTFPLLEAPLVVRLGGGGAHGAGPAVELTLRGASLLVGSFDAPNHLEHMAKHRERLIHDVARRLASEDADPFTRPQAERHLKRVMLEAIAASLGTDPTQEYPSTYLESPGRYGVIDVLLPDGFKLVQLSSLR